MKTKSSTKAKDKTNPFVKEDFLIENCQASSYRRAVSDTDSHIFFYDCTFFIVI